MRVKVQDMNSKKTFELDVSPQDTVSMLKLSISQHDTTYQSETTMLRIAGRPAKGEHLTLREMGIDEG